MSWFRDFRKIVFFTGAGMSAESGVPTYRGEGGIWRQYRYEDYACQEAFDRYPEWVWEFHEQRRAMTGACQPHSGHRLLAELQKSHANVTIVTQNIDRMHQKAGATLVHELHGSMWRLRCDRCGVVEENLDVPMKGYKHSCGEFWRPDIVWFGDSLRAEVVDAALTAIRQCNLLISVGTSGVVKPAANFPRQARSAGAYLIEINPEPTDLSDIYDECLRGPASEVLALLNARNSVSG